MAKAFTNLRSTKLLAQSKITFGKYKDCRVCDVWDDFEYFLWLHKNNPSLLDKSVVDTVKAAEAAYAAKIYKEQEIDPYLKQDLDDLPF